MTNIRIQSVNLPMIRTINVSDDPVLLFLFTSCLIVVDCQSLDQIAIDILEISRSDVGGTIRYTCDCVRTVLKWRVQLRGFVW